MSENLGYLFYKQYYWKDNKTKNQPLPEIEIDIRSLQSIMSGRKDCKMNSEINEELINAKLPDYDHLLSCKVHNQSFELTTIYPGLLIGSGYIHEAGFENEFKIGFHFDYTTGIPVIPGSSIKGMLRSVFPLKENRTEIKKSKVEYLESILSKLQIDCIPNIEDLERNIFDGIDKNGKRIPVYQRDIFFEAFPIKSKKEKEIFLAEDYITPHKDPLKNPKPIKLLKILPDVKFRFQFRLNEFNKIITADVKEELFKKIILDLGLGAKTNVGYGALIERIPRGLPRGYLIEGRD